MNIRRNTRQKNYIMEALACADHPTATELYETLKEKYPALSRGTVFRVLSQFADEGKISRLGSADGSVRYDAGKIPHAHAQCLRCGKIRDLFGDEYAAILNTKLPDGFTVYSSRIEYLGLCGACAESGNN